MRAARLRDVWIFTRPAGHSGGGLWSEEEAWTVAILEELRPGDARFLVQGRMRYERRTHDGSTRRIPVRVPAAEPYRCNTLGQARAKARDLATVLAGRMSVDRVGGNRRDAKGMFGTSVA